MKPVLCIIIVNYRSAQLVVDCLHSLAAQISDLERARVVIVDNDSGDGSPEVLDRAIREEHWSAWVDVVVAPRNGGFAYGNNVGVRHALQTSQQVDYVMLLNPDTLVRSHAVSSLLAFMQAHPRAGIAGSLLENPGGGIDCSAHRAHSPLGELDGGARLGLLSRILHRYVVSEPPRDHAHECEWVSGASMMVRRALWDAIGPMDEEFFLYFEEVDFCSRARLSGWQVWYVPESRVMHLEGASTGIRAARRRAAYWYDSRRRYFIKHHGLGGLLLADLLWGIGRSTYLLRRALGLGGRNHTQDPRWLTYDLLWGDLRAVFNGRVAGITRLQRPS